MKFYIQLLFYIISINVINAKKKILSFGGNGMIGSNTLQNLISTDDYNITLISRGSWPFDTETTIKPYVNHIKCDRDNGLKSCRRLLMDIENTDEYYAVLDFSGFLPSWIEDAIEVLQAKARVYIYVSSDSVYEVCGDGKPLPKYEKLLETDAQRPLNKTMRKKLNAKDEYGDEKLGGEEVLVKQGKKGGMPYVILRYADVIGPHDATDRFGTYVIWAKLLQLADKNIVPDLHIPYDILESSSITYVDDATQSIISSINTPNAWNEAYNIASSEIFNVTKGIEIIATHVTSNAPRITRVENGVAMYPSVTRGPISIDKAISKLKFKPTPLDQVLSDTVQWYLDMFETDLNFRDLVIQEWEDSLFTDLDMFSERVQDEVMEHVWSIVPLNEEVDDEEL